ncbi:MAG: GMP synthase subunit A [Candidatus Bathyarchaeia archaeon]|nr:GMP synthase subunit A [Candidatus Bathyarchaeota archaeon]
MNKRKANLKILVVSLGGQYNHLISRVLSELNVENQIIPLPISLNQIIELGIDGLVFGGGPQKVYEEFKKGAFNSLSEVIMEVEVPCLCICAAHQLLALIYNGEVGPAEYPEFGPIEVEVIDEDEILKGLKPSFIAWSSHNDEVKKLPKQFKLLAKSKKCLIQAIKHESKPVFGVQFHPEVYHTTNGKKIFENFINIVKEARNE